MKGNIIFIILILGLVSCDGDYKLSLVNNSDEKIRYLHQIKPIADTIPFGNIKECDGVILDYILPKKEVSIPMIFHGWEDKLRDNPNFLRIYIVNEDTFKKYNVGDGSEYNSRKDSLHNYNMCDVFKKQIFIKRFDLKYEDLVKADWKIIYDGK